MKQEFNKPMKNYTVDVIIPTYKPGKQFHKLMQILSGQDYPIHSIRIMNTEKKYFPEAGIYEKCQGWKCTIYLQRNLIMAALEIEPPRCLIRTFYCL